ncbi:MAG: serine/threonine-protein kinase, partial [Planctomycetota bacterium JB042]
MSDGRPLPSVQGFRVLRLLGEGGMGVVYEAEQESPRRRVALKLVREADVDPDSIARLELEADALARLTHPGVVPPPASGRTDDGAPWLALELVDGVPLDRYVREERPSLRERVARFEELCAAVAPAHQRGVVHRYLKPSNVLVAPRGEGSGGGARVRVLDFGL